MVGSDTTNPEPGLTSVPSLPFFERLAPPASATEFVAAIETWTKPGEIVLDLNGRGGWVARAAIAEQRRAADFEMWPLTRLLADVTLRPPDIRQLDKAVAAIANAPLGGTTVRKTIESLYASTCPRCGKQVVLEAMVWQPVPRPAAGAPAPKKKPHRPGAVGSGAGSSLLGSGSSATSPAALLPEWSYGPDESLRPLAREYRCAQCHEQVGGAELRAADPTHADVRLAESVLPSGAVREAMRKRFPAPRPTHPLVDQLIDLHTPRQLMGLHAILTRIDSEDRMGTLTATLRLAFLHAVIIAGRLNASHGKPAPLRIANGVIKIPPAREWREINPWEAFEGGLKLVKAYTQRLESGMPRSAYARPGVDMASLEGTTANVTVGEATHAGSARRADVPRTVSVAGAADAGADAAALDAGSAGGVLSGHGLDLWVGGRRDAALRSALPAARQDERRGRVGQPGARDCASSAKPSRPIPTCSAAPARISRWWDWPTAYTLATTMATGDRFTAQARDFTPARL